MGYTHYFEVLDKHKYAEILPYLFTDLPAMVEAVGVHVDISHGETPLAGFRLKAVEGCEPLEVPAAQAKANQFLFTKTNRRPYDLTVCLILLRIKQLAGEAWELRSDGRWDVEWLPARKLYNQLFPGEDLQCPWVDERDQRT